ncbi:MAG: AMP-binding protein [Rhizobiales bacterium]|nr:AMP-binding protein [Hyphomicrobiales bacterium]
MPPAVHYDSLETRSPQTREASQFSLLGDLIAKAVRQAPGWARHLAGAEPREIASRSALARLPVLRKSDLAAHQQATPPFGGFSTGRATRIFSSPGPIYEPEGAGTDWWRAARALHAAGLGADDIVLNTFAYHLTPGGWIMDGGARALGCTVIAAGPGNTEQQLAAIAHLRPTAYVGVPDFLNILLEKGAAASTNTSSLRKAMVSGGALFPSLREAYAARGITCLQCYATAELGVVAYETRHEGELVHGMIVNEGVILEIVRPGTGDPVADGEVGEVVVTTFNPDYPMIRLATGDLSAIIPEPSPCGRTNVRIKGWMGRADQTTKIKGMFVHPSQIADIARRHAGLGRLRLVVTRANEQDTMTLRAEAATGTPADLAAQLAATLRDVTKLAGRVEIASPGSLPNDGKVIADERDYSAP